MCEKLKNALCTIKDQTIQALASTILDLNNPESITHIRTFSDNVVYVALQHTSVVEFDQGFDLGSFPCLEMAPHLWYP